MKHIKYFKESVTINQFSREERFKPYNIEKILKQYLVTVIWAAPDENDFEDREVSDFSNEAKKQAKKEIEWFVDVAGDAIYSANINDQELGHQLLLTRNGHGSGFWDNNYRKEDEEILVKMCEILGNADAYVGDDGKIYISSSDEYKKFDVEQWKEEMKLKKATDRYNI